ncbi:hypothetical protein BDR03DRAFT_999396 [Suillus americanus]|nr:hypothetical protein BDR03DRAFT_999396 [Suillus americanus]
MNIPRTGPRALTLRLWTEMTSTPKQLGRGCFYQSELIRECQGHTLKLQGFGRHIALRPSPAEHVAVADLGLVPLDNIQRYSTISGTAIVGVLLDARISTTATTKRIAEYVAPSTAADDIAHSPQQEVWISDPEHRILSFVMDLPECSLRRFHQDFP